VRTLLALLILGVLLSLTGEASAETSSLWISTPYPSLTAAGGDELVIDLIVHNGGTEPRLVDLALANLPDGWTAGFLGAGRPVSALMADPDSDAKVELHVTPPEGLDQGTYDFTVTAKSDGTSLTLPIQLALVASLPARLQVTADFPAVKGVPTAEFSYRITIENKGGEEALVNLGVDAPANFEVTLTESYGSHQLTSIPIEAGAKKQIDIKVKPPRNAQAGVYDIVFHAQSGNTTASDDLKLEIVGVANLSLSTASERYSTEASAAEETALQVILTNNGSAPAENVNLHAVEPNSWKVIFSPEGIDRLDAGQSTELTALITPPDSALAGDYIVKIQAVAGPASDSKEFRVTVRASQLWGIVGIAIIVLAVLVLVAAMWRFGRR